MYGYIYMTINLINGKKYIGQKKWSKYPSKHPSYLGSGMELKRAIKKYGKENFSCHILEWCKNSWDLDCREKAWILMYNAVKDPGFYNIAKGGYATNPDHISSTLRAKDQQDKLTKEQVLAIYSLKGKMSQKEIATKYGVSKITISDIQRGHSWAWLTGASYKPDKRLTNEEIEEIYSLKGKMSQKEIATKYGVSKNTVGRIHRGEFHNTITKQQYKPTNKTLTDEEILSIYSLKGKMKQGEIAEKFGILKETVGRIHRGEVHSKITKGDNEK